MARNFDSYTDFDYYFDDNDYYWKPVVTDPPVDTNFTNDSYSSNNFSMATNNPDYFEDFMFWDELQFLPPITTENFTLSPTIQPQVQLQQQQAQVQLQTQLQPQAPFQQQQQVQLQAQAPFQQAQFQQHQQTQYQQQVQIQPQVLFQQAQFQQFQQVQAPFHQNIQQQQAQFQQHQQMQYQQQVQLAQVQLQTQPQPQVHLQQHQQLHFQQQTQLLQSQSLQQLQGYQDCFMPTPTPIMLQRTPTTTTTTATRTMHSSHVSHNTHNTIQVNKLHGIFIDDAATYYLKLRQTNLDVNNLAHLFICSKNKEGSAHKMRKTYAEFALKIPLMTTQFVVVTNSTAAIFRENNGKFQQSVSENQIIGNSLILYIPTISNLESVFKTIQPNDTHYIVNVHVPRGGGVQLDFVISTPTEAKRYSMRR